MTKIIDLTGKRFFRLMVVKRSLRKTREGALWDCFCDCGQLKTVRTYSLRHGVTKSCGCWRKDESRIRHTTHGLNGTPIYKTWRQMLRRCYDKNFSIYPYYGGRGIKVCKRWKNLENFHADMGERPSQKHSIDRKNTNKGYFPENCKWATHTEQVRNRRNGKLTLPKAIEIIELRNSTGMTYKEIGKKFNIGTDHAWQVCKGTLWEDASLLAKRNKDG